MNDTGLTIIQAFILLLIGGAVFLSGCSSYQNNSIPPSDNSSLVPGNETIRIGAVYNLEGSEATFDLPSMQGANLAVQVINEQGGINGKPLELVLVNGKSDTDTIVAGVTELVSSGTIPVIIGLSNPDHTLPAAKRAASAGVYFITSGATSPRLPQQVPQYLYLACMGDNTQAAVSAEYATGSLQAKNVYVLYESDKGYPTLLADYFKRRFLELDGTVQKTDTFQSTDAGFSSQVANLSLLDPEPDIVFVSAETWADAKPVIEEIRKAGFRMPVMGGDGYDSPTLLAGGAEGIDTVFYTTHTWFDPSPGSDMQQRFMTRYQKEYQSPAVPFAGLGYDTVMIVAEAIRSSKQSATFPDGMDQISLYCGVTGNLSYSGNTHIPEKTVTLMKIQNGTPVHIGEFIPMKVPSP